MAGAAPAAEQPRTRAAADQPQATIGPAARRWTAGAPAGEDDGLAGSGVGGSATAATPASSCAGEAATAR
ncbi:hypothetical protein Scep_030254 [Stephania cephalantha]|uniref:Uncharacterized protein n=1 Tax=Stephania cephalantha TaxID=152367 RepID=A0AAP0E706_9MAGN